MIIAVNFQLKQLKRSLTKSGASTGFAPVTSAVIPVHFQPKQLERRRLNLTVTSALTDSNPVEALILFQVRLSSCLSWKFTAIIILHFRNSSKLHKKPCIRVQSKGVPEEPSRRGRTLVKSRRILVYYVTVVTIVHGGHIGRRAAMMC